ncbi:tetratricopeptide repeat protein [Pedobacter hartonius]|uniref:Tetratricopeptide repeat-containing protein n=1 Tax=Pedobacter hartonius TaxID=425514 RepID=A0A1H3Z946_9SPHI|nr:tetratricopeptide repeat protein [Pedobacter hartonius]SEA20246.1 Tetratricopeptide repeat-containing protein [Pedobacter hartonius]
MKKNFVFLVLLLLPALVLAQTGNDEEAAMQYYQEGNYKKAAEALEGLFSRTKDDAYFGLYFNALLKSKQYPEAEKVTKKLIRQNPASLKYEIALGRVYKEEGQQENSAKTFDHVVSNLPKDETVIREIANNLYQIEEYDVAIKVFQQGRKTLGNEQAFIFELLSLYRYKKDKAMLVQEFLNALGSTPQMLPQAQTVLSSVFEGNSDYLNLQNTLFKKIQIEPENESYTRLLIWQYLQQQEYDMALRQLIAQDKRTRADGTALFENAQVFTSNKAYDTAIKAYDYLVTKGKDNPYYLPSRLAAVDARYQSLLLGKNNEAEVVALASQYQAIIDEYGKNSRTLFAMRKLATIEAYYLHHLEKAEEALETAVKIPGISAAEMAELKLELGDVYVLTGQPWEAILVYGQVAKDYENQNIGNEAKYRSARLSFFQGNFSYAKSQADVLKASTTQLIANDALNLSLLISDHLETAADTLALKLYASAELMQFRNNSKAALDKLDSISVLYPQNRLADDILMAKSRIYMKSGDFNKSAALLKELIAHPQQNIWTDDALFILAGLYEEHLHEPEQAKILYQRLITDFPGSMFTAEARKHFRKLRGDNIES